MLEAPEKMILYLALAFGTGIFALGLFGALRYRPGKWSQIMGTVVFAKPVKQPSRFGNLFSPHIRYRYDVCGESYEGDRYAFSSAEDNGSLEQVSCLISKFPEGASTPVWYLKHQPAESCLKPFSNYSRSQVWALMVGGALTNFAALLLFLAGRH